jgi:hypothetical protein
MLMLIITIFFLPKVSLLSLITVILNKMLLPENDPAVYSKSKRKEKEG